MNIISLHFAFMIFPNHISQRSTKLKQEKNLNNYAYIEIWH